MSSLTQSEFYVATNGNDANPGTIAAPFATPARARDAVRELKKAAGENGRPTPVNVFIRGGAYSLTETMLLTAEDSGTQGCPVTYAAYAGETPVLSGGIRVTGWEKHTEQIVRARLPESIGRRFTTRQLFHKGRRLPRARWPKCDPADRIRTGWTYPEGPVPGQAKQAFHFRQEVFPRRWQKPHEGEVNIYTGHGWCNSIIPIDHVDYDRRVIRLAHEALFFDLAPWYFQIPITSEWRFFVENMLEDLTQPGEWCYDSSDRTVYLQPSADFDENQVVVPVLDCLVRMLDTQWITWRGLTFTQTTGGDNYHRSGLEGYGAMFPQPGQNYCGEAMHLCGASRCVLEKCHFDQVGGNAIYLERQNQRNVIRWNEIGYAGANAVVLIGARAFHPMFNEVTDNHIHHAGAINNYVAGVFLGLSDGNLVAHNSIHDMPHHAINLGSNGVGRNTVEFNDIRRVCLEISDTGAINSWMDVPGPWIDPNVERSGHVIRYNLIVDVPGCKVENEQIVPDWSTRGIYLDDCTSNCLVSGNVIVRAGMGFQVHAGKHNVIENNIVLDCKIGVYTCDGPPLRLGNAHIKGMFRGNEFMRNIVVLTQPDPCLYSFHDWTELTMARCDENLFWQPAAPDPHVDWIDHPQGLARSAFADWQNIGFDQHSLIADPLFVDAANGDYRLRAESPALKLGFQPIPLDRIGVRRSL